MSKTPTKEELAAQAKKAEEEIETAIEDGDTELDDEKDDDQDDDSSGGEADADEGGVDEQDDDSKDDESDDEKDEDQDDDSEKDSKGQKHDWKKRYQDSSREGQRQASINRKVNQAIVESKKVNDISEEELKAEYPEWDSMTETERKIARKAAIADKRLELVDKASEEAEKEEAWTDKMVEFVTDPKTLNENPDLDGKEEAFLQFVTQAKYRNVPTDVLVSSFLYEQSKGKSKKKGQMFETGSAGPNEKASKSSKEKMSLDEARKLMKSDYRAYVKAVRDGRVNLNI